MSTKTVPTVYQSSKQSKDSKNSKNDIGVPIVTCLPSLYQQCSNSVPNVKNSQKTDKTAKITVGVPIVTCLPSLYQQCTNGQKQPKDSQNSKNHRWCTNRRMSTQNPPNTRSLHPPNTQSRIDYHTVDYVLSESTFYWFWKHILH